MKNLCEVEINPLGARLCIVIYLKKSLVHDAPLFLMFFTCRNRSTYADRLSTEHFLLLRLEQNTVLRKVRVLVAQYVRKLSL